MRIPAIKACLASALLIVWIPSQTLAKDAERSFTVVNANKDVAILRLWFAESSEGPWRELKINEIKPGSSYKYVTKVGRACLFDVKIQFSDQYIQQFELVNLCNGQTVTAT